VKKILHLPLGLFLWFNASAQAPLPTSANFDDPLSTGWSESLDVVVGNTRYTNGLVNASCRLDGTGEHVLVNYGDVCGSVTYHIKGQGSALTNDVFTIQESANGTTWTAMRTLTGAQINNNEFQQYVDVPQASSRYIRFFFTQKQSGRNIALDEITLEPQVPTNDQEINVSVGGNAVFTGNFYVIGNAPSTTFTITNFNLPSGEELNISSMSITGVNASDFTISGVPTPFSVAANGTESFDVNFSAGANGSRFATLTIENDDANGDETTYVIDLYGIGGNFATEPAASATSFNISDVTTYGYDVSFSAASPAAEQYLVTRGINAAFLTPPTDGQTYVKGDYIDAITQVVYVGPAATFRPTNVVAGTEYNFNVFAFNGPSGYENYRTDDPLMGGTTTPDNLIGNYYQGIDAASSSFLNALQNRLNSPYSQTFYSNYAPVMLDNFAARDTTDGQRVVNCVYSGYAHLYPGAFFYDVLSREHTWPHSWMPTWPDQEGDEYSDLHNLFPAHQNSANAVRSNRPLGVVVNQTSSFLGAKYGTDASGNIVYEPRDSHKGDAARAIFYMAAKWNGTAGSWQLPDPIDFLVQYGQDQDVLKQWHWQDPPSNYEIARNDYIESVQGNRNPFVDSVNWVCYIDFSDMTLLEPTEIPCLTTPNSIQEVQFGSVGIFPNPTTGDLTVQLDLRQAELLLVEVMDISGRAVYSAALNAGQGASQHLIDLNGLSEGVYVLSLRGQQGVVTERVVVR
jgi:hypothetical protein